MREIQSPVQSRNLKLDKFGGFRNHSFSFHLGYSGSSHGIINTTTTITSKLNGTPTRRKSPNVYSPGVTTRVFTGDEIGVMNAVDAASATIITNGYREAWRASAIAIATGAIRTAVAVFEMNNPSTAVMTNRLARMM